MLPSNISRYSQVQMARVEQAFSVSVESGGATVGSFAFSAFRTSATGLQPFDRQAM